MSTRDVASVEQSWGRIVRWLEQHLPATAEGVNPPAAETEIAALVGELGTELPADLIAWWRVANGVRWDRGRPRGSILPLLYAPLPVEQVREYRTMLVGVERDCGDPDELADDVAELAGTPAWAWLPTSVPIAADGGGAELFVDLRPGPHHGCVTEHDKVGASGAGMIWPSVAVMLADVAHAYETGDYTQVYQPGARPRVADGWLEWERAAVEPTYPARLRDAYQQCAQLLARGGFQPAPAGQWDADLLGAHLVLLTEELAAVTEAILAGHPPQRYDNARTVDEAVLRRYADEHPDAGARLAELGPRLADLATRLGNTPATVHVVWHDYGMRLGDRPGPWRSVLETHGNRVYQRADELRRMR